MPRIHAASIAEHKAKTRAALTKAAETLFATVGYDATSHADIAALAGIGRTTFYDYFTSKEDLLAEIVEEQLPALVADIVAGIDEHASNADQLGALVRRTLEFAARDHILGFLLKQETAALSDEVRRRVGNAHGALGLEFMAIYERGVAAGEFRGLPQGIGRPLVQDLIMSAARTLMDLNSPLLRLDDVSDAVTSLLLDGLSL